VDPGIALFDIHAMDERVDREIWQLSRGSCSARPAAVAALGIGLGIVATAIAILASSRVLVGVNTRDPVSVAGGALVLVIAAFAASYFPARRSSRVPAIEAMRL
jgi:hypothetical protein